ncbi:g10461 [Coccomyxa viridis]|uniref:G10461 protein n=1 Tax=Coccomyxa viridis TaxID=1274662 RepID=A0ABP1GBF4_9CHLO
MMGLGIEEPRLDKVEDETSSANNAFSGMGTPSVSQLESPAEAPQMSTGIAGLPGLATAGSMLESEAYGEEDANKKDTAAADDLRELAAKGVCAPLWRTNQPVQPGTTEAAVHTLQTGWCFYAGLESAKRSNVWLASQSPAALSMAAAAGQLPGMQSPHTPQRLPPSPSGQESLLQALHGVAEKARTSTPWLNNNPTLREMLDRQLAENNPSTPRSPFDNGAGPNLSSIFKTPEKHEQPRSMIGLNSSSTPSTNTNIDLNSMPSPESLEDMHMGRDIRHMSMQSSRSMPNELFLDQVRMSPDGDWGSLGAQMRMDEDGAMPAFSDPLRDAKNSPTQSNFSAPDNLQGMRSPEGAMSGQSAPQLPEKVMMALVSTPAVFAVPSSINKGFNPPFVLRVGIVSNAPTQIKATVAAYVLQKDQVANLEKWHPAQHVVTESLSGAIVTQKIVCHGPSHPKLPQPSPGKHTGVAEFIFNDLKFHSSSRMKPRWLAFALTLPTDDVLFVQYTVPTIVMSRQCDQHSKAMSILRGQVPWRKRQRGDQPVHPSTPPQPLRSTMSAPIGAVEMAAAAPPAEETSDGDWSMQGPYNFDRWRDMIERNCKFYSLIRPFDKDDLRMLAKVAGFFSNQAHHRMAPFELTPGQWQAFGNWFMSYLRLFRCHQQLWMMRSPTAICGFGVDRARAETLLAHQPSGTFLVRPSLSLAGAMVLSVVVGSVVKHMALDGNQLDTRSLEVWIRDVREAVELLDEATGNRTPKEQVFLLHYRRFGVVTDLVKSGGAPIHMFSANMYSLPHAALSNSLMTGGAGGPGMPTLPTQLSVSMSTGCSA